MLFGYPRLFFEVGLKRLDGRAIDVLIVISDGRSMFASADKERGPWTLSAEVALMASWFTDSCFVDQWKTRSS